MSLTQVQPMETSRPPSFGSELPDQLTESKPSSTIKSRFMERVALERQYGASLQLLVRKAMDKRSKREEALSVGLETSKPWNETSSLVKNIIRANEEASDHTNLAESLSNEVCEVLKTCEKKKEATRKRHVEFGVKLLAERDKIYHDRAKAKQRYDDACSLNMDVHTNEMLSAKNAYLLSISVANEVKRRFYHVDLPSLEDDFSLFASKLVSLLKTVSQLNSKYLESLRTHNENFLIANNTINGQTNQSLFIEYNRRPFTDPPDFIFEPCPIWHDSAEYALTSPEPKVLLQNRLGQAHYFKERVALERQYGASLQLLVRKAMDKRSKREEALSVGLETSKPWNGTSRAGGHKKSGLTLVKNIIRADEEASDHTNLAESLSNEVVNQARYDDAMFLVESTRVKQGQAKDDKHLEKAAKNMDVHTNEMLSAKNAYLLSISVANEVKRRFYHVDLPSLEDDFQLLISIPLENCLSIKRQVSRINTIEDHSRTHQISYLNHFTTKSIRQARSKASELEPTIEAKRHEITGLENLREAYSSNESLGDPDEVVENLLESNFSTVLTKELKSLNKHLEMIKVLKDHTLSNLQACHSYNCCLCNSNIWGIAKQGVTCKACSISAHVKCGPKVPSNCAGSAPLTGLKRNVSIAPLLLQLLDYVEGIDTIPNQGGLTRAVSTSNRPPAVQTHGLGVGGAGGVSRSATTANRSVAPPVNRNPFNRSQARPQARMIYGYEASSGFEVSASGKIRSCYNVSPDDGSGWIKVETSSKQLGLVPATYVELIPNNPTTPVPATPSSPAPASLSTGPTPVPSRLKRAKALYDWAAQAPDEHSLAIGETVTLSKGGETYGQGWFEIIKDGRKGIVPSNYVELL
ncbi:hypothetical protein PSHT_15488 [Puccinia striiformis]|uniref:SH3 domain-containing protein n=1 Tax=Puccinia striiformis TaxID=27350 RepID=A0A2S4UET1_9BASI|nr:hypothetical protein PSHT_15488 [Puccinia striiformis]